MATEITVPTLGESVTEATVAKWFKAEGDAVAVDEAIVELETDKVTLEVNASAAGTLSEISRKTKQRRKPKKRRQRRPPRPRLLRNRRRRTTRTSCRLPFASWSTKTISMPRRSAAPARTAA